MWGKKLRSSLLPSSFFISLLNFVHFFYDAHFQNMWNPFSFFFWLSFCISWQYVWVHFMICILKLMFNLNIFCKNCKKKKIKKSYIIFNNSFFFVPSFFFQKMLHIIFFPIFYLFLQITLYVKTFSSCLKNTFVCHQYHEKSWNFLQIVVFWKILFFFFFLHLLHSSFFKVKHIFIYMLCIKLAFRAIKFKIQHLSIHLFLVWMTFPSSVLNFLDISQLCA